MATKPKLNDMSIDPSTLKVKSSKETEVSSSDSKAPKAPRVLKEKKDPKHRPSHHKGHGKQKATVCVKRGDVVAKVDRATVEAKYISAGWNYCSRSVWRAYRDSITTAPSVTSDTPVTSEKPSKKSKKKSQEA